MAGLGLGGDFAGGGGVEGVVGEADEEVAAGVDALGDALDEVGAAAEGDGGA